MNNKNNFTREDIAESLHNDFGLTKKDCIIFVNDIIDIIIDGLKNNGYVKIQNIYDIELQVHQCWDCDSEGEFVEYVEEPERVLN